MSSKKINAVWRAASRTINVKYVAAACGLSGRFDSIDAFIPRQHKLLYQSLGVVCGVFMNSQMRINKIVFGYQPCRKRLFANKRNTGVPENKL